MSERHAAAIYAKGMCCPSSAICVRNKIVKLGFVDSSQFVGGLKLDPKAQLAMVACKQGRVADLEALGDAIVDAGHDPVFPDVVRGSQLQTPPLGSP